RSTRGTHIDNQKVPFNQRRRGNSKEILWYLEFCCNIALPVQLTSLELEAMQLAFSANRVKSIAVDNRTRPRTIVVSVAIRKLCWVTELPVSSSSFRMKTLQNLFVSHPVQEHESFTCHGR